MKFLFIPLDMMGHINAGIGLALTLRDHGHSIHYVVDSLRQDLVQGYDFDVHPIDYKNPYNFEAVMYQKFSHIFKRQYFAYLKSFLSNLDVPILFRDYFKMIIFKNRRIESLIKEVNPDILIVDELYVYPSLVYSGKPWIFFHSPNPRLFYQDYNLPIPTLGPGWSKYPIVNWSLWKFFNFLISSVNRLIMLWCGIFKSEDWLLPVSPWLNLYCIPDELDHHGKVMKYADNSFRLDHLMHKDMMNKEMAPNLEKFIRDHSDKKLIYISLGTIACDDLDIIKKLVEILSRSKFFCIVSKGTRHNQFELSDNMWGDRYLPQKSVLQRVDLFITHGGNNSVTEAFSLGVPMIVIPVWMDQVDNAERIHELGYGVRLDPIRFTEEDLLGAIDTLLSDVEIRNGLKLISTKILKQNRLELAANLIENIKFANHDN